MPTNNLPRLQERLDRYDRLARRIRNDPRLWQENEKIYQLLTKVLAVRKRLRQRLESEPNRGPFSQLTWQELRMSGTCETDWY